MGNCPNACCNDQPDEKNGLGPVPPKEIRLEEIGAEIGKLVASKNRKYGDSFFKSGNVLRELYPNGIRPDQYIDVLCIVRIIDKLFRIATDKTAFEESPYNDIGGYGVLGKYNDETLYTK